MSKWLASSAKVQRPLGTVVIGGLISATAFTLLLVLPTAYAWIEERFAGADVRARCSDGRKRTNDAMTTIRETASLRLGEDK